MGEAPTSQGVDLFELERLRVLVRFEFERELTQDELVAALTRCHNNTREAYHYLKEQRRQEQLRAAADMVAAATATTASPGRDVNGHNRSDIMGNNDVATSGFATGNSNGNNAKRRSDSDGNHDGDVKMDTSNKRHRTSMGDCVVTVDLSQGDDNAEMTQATQQSEDSDSSASPRPRHYNLERATQILTDVVAKITQASRSTQDDAQWLSAALEALTVKRAPQLDDPLVVVVESLANALKHVPVTDVVAVRSDGVNQIMDALLQIPRQDQYELELRLKPSDAKMQEDAAMVESKSSVMLMDQMKKSERAQAARNAITVIKDALSSCVARQESIVKAVKSSQSHRRRVRARITDLKSSIEARLEQAGRDVKTSEQELVQARNNQMTHTAALMAIVMRHKQSYLAEGEEEADATLNAHAAVVHSANSEVVRLRQVREESQLLHKARKQDVMRANTRLEFYQKLEALRQQILPCIHEWLDVSTSRVEMLKADAERVVEDKMKAYVAKMIQALRLYYEFHTMRQLLATKEREKQKETLNEHMEFYDDLVPSSKKEIENKILEFNGVIVHSTQCMREVAALQCELWEGKKQVLPKHVYDVVEIEYGKLFNALSGGAKDMMLDCVKVIRDQPGPPPSVPSPVFSPVNVLYAPPTVTPYEFVGRDFDSRHPQPARGSLVDLTQDDDGDVAMDGFPRERFVVSQPSFQASNPVICDLVSGSAVTPEVSIAVKVEEKPSSQDISPRPREFPMGSHLCWMLKDEFGETHVFSGYVKERTPGGSYMMEDSEGREHTIPVGNLFTYEEKEAFSREQNFNVNDDEASKEGCVVM